MRTSFLLVMSLIFLMGCKELLDNKKTSTSSAAISTESSQSGDANSNSSNGEGTVFISGTQKVFIAQTNVLVDAQLESQLTLQFGITVKRRFRKLKGFVFSATDLQAEALKASPVILGVQAEVAVKMSLNTAVSQIEADHVHNEGYNGTGTKVCIIDSGLNDHANLPNPDAEYDFYNSDSIAEDQNGHGTAVAGIIASNHSAGIGINSYKGVAPGSRLLIAKVFGAADSSSSATIVSALDWCADNGAEVINMSLGHGGYSSACDTEYTALFANNTAALGIVVVAASGNDGYTDKISSPACGSKVLSVGSVSKTDARSSFSNGASILNVMAPGEYITTTNKNGSFSTFSGTSAATPFVTGVAALLKSLPEDPSAEEIKLAIKTTAKDLGAVGKDNLYGNGRIDAYAAYNYISGNGSGGGPLTFETSSGVLDGSVQGSQYRSNQSYFQVDCPADHYLSDLEIQKSVWFLYPTITWFKYHCQSMKSLDTSKSFGRKRYSGDTNVSKNHCADKKAITGLEVTYDWYIKDFRIQCADLSYHASVAGDVSTINKTISQSTIFGRGDFNDSEELIECPEGEVVVGFEGNSKSDRNEWAITKFGVRCSPIQTKYE